MRTIIIAIAAGFALSIAACGDDLAPPIEAGPDGHPACLSTHGGQCLGVADAAGVAPDARTLPDAAPYVAPADAEPYNCADHCPAPGDLTECADCSLVCAGGTIATCAACPDAASFCDNRTPCLYAPSCSEICKPAPWKIECAIVGSNVCACVSPTGDRHTCMGGT